MTTATQKKRIVIVSDIHENESKKTDILNHIQANYSDLDIFVCCGDLLNLSANDQNEDENIKLWGKVSNVTC
eukprot:GABW01004627.1.p1 GENE.GABW01004627.1~~GABW01004627.1.p1  ORF type:complete len:72 (+),score=4.29 GABW01004627.1:168-383(+)